MFAESVEVSRHFLHVLVVVELLEQVGQIEYDLPLCLLAETISRIEHSEDVDEHAVERLLDKGMRRRKFPVRPDLTIFESSPVVSSLYSDKDLMRLMKSYVFIAPVLCAEVF